MALDIDDVCRHSDRYGHAFLVIPNHFPGCSTEKTLAKMNSLVLLTAFVALISCPWGSPEHKLNSSSHVGPTLIVPADGATVRFSIKRSGQKSQDHGAIHRHEIGFFYVDAPDGRILRRASSRPDAAPVLDARKQPQFTRPGDRDYAEVALRDGHAAALFAGGIRDSGAEEDVKVALQGDRFLGFYIIENQTLESWRYAPTNEKPRVWFSFPSANPGNQVCLQKQNTSDRGQGWNCFEWKIGGVSTSITTYSRL